jgi:crossover junction endodeoxyribonuclease RuvC
MSEVILGIDPGLTRCGFGVISKGKSRNVAFVAVGIIQSPSTMNISARLALIGDGIAKVLDEQKPNRVAIERVFSQKNLNTVIGIAQISGIISYLSHQRGIPVVFYTPTEVKSTVTGSGKAAKDQVTLMVTKILKLKEIPKPADAADALAIAITSAWKGDTSSLVSDLSQSETSAQKKWRLAIASSKQSK